MLVVFLALPLFGDNDAVKKAREASDARPQHPTLLYRLAIALDANGQREEAVRTLDRIATMGFVYPVEKDFANERYAAVTKRFALNAKPIGTAKRELAIDRLGLIPEGMAWDGKRFFVSSVRTKTIFAGDREFATAPWGVFGMVADPKRGVLWATTTALPQTEGFKAEEKGKSALLRIDLREGRVLETLPAPDGEHHFGDVAIAPDGEVYVSDSVSPVIFRVKGNTLEPFARGPFRSLQGLAVSGATLYVADYSNGIFAIDRRTGDIHPLRVPATISLLGIDGLYAVDANTLIGTQNGTNPYRILRITLAPGGLAVSSAKTLLANSPLMGDPTLGFVANNRFYFNGNAQWELFGEDGKISDPLKLSEAVVLSVPLR
ncbi:MAG TPA: tetratricopeptide repeat protein [Thermoanaerobaculia bacterium]|nr:tetratricopeptide repeat protein [Thermoanaerobaculia bacterium]